VKAENEGWASRRGGGSDDRGHWTSTIETENAAEKSAEDGVEDFDERVRD